jgi:hypothetical protein
MARDCTYGAAMGGKWGSAHHTVLMSRSSSASFSLISAFISGSGMRVRNWRTVLAAVTAAPLSRILTSVLANNADCANVRPNSKSARRQSSSISWLWARSDSYSNDSDARSMARRISRLVTRGNGSLLPDPVTVSRCLAAVLFFVLLEFFKCSSACLPCCTGCFFPLGARYLWNARTRVRDLGDGVMIHAS